MHPIWNYSQHSCSKLSSPPPSFWGNETNPLRHQTPNTWVSQLVLFLVWIASQVGKRSTLSPTQLMPSRYLVPTTFYICILPI